MSVALIGGMDRLKRHYMNEARQHKIALKVFTQQIPGMSSKIKNVDAIVLFTNKISHNAKKTVITAAKINRIPVYMYHTCGVCTLRECFHCLKGKEIETCQ